MTIRTVDPKSREYFNDYRAGWAASERMSEGALDRADSRNVSHAWYDGYHDHAAGRDKWTWQHARVAGFSDIDVYLRTEYASWVVNGNQPGTDRTFDLVAAIASYEAGDLDDASIIDLFQYIVNHRLDLQLQGAYGRTAQRMLDAGVILPPERT